MVSNVNEVIRVVLNSLFFFTKRFHTHTKTQKHKSTKTQPSKSTKRYKRTKIKNALKKHLNANKRKVTYSLVCVFLLVKCLNKEV